VLSKTLLSRLGLDYDSTACVSKVFAAQSVAAYPDCSLALLAVRNSRERIVDRRTVHC
jgi:hypothetical protein